MLDLNFGVTVSQSDSMEVEDFQANSLPRMEDSGTSNSSIVNTGEALAPSHSGKHEESSNTLSGFIFDIMRKQMERDGANWVDDGNPSTELQTQPLFPVAGNGGDSDVELRLGLAASARPQWMNLSFPVSGGGQSEVKSFQEKQPLVRKRRRGPRSRSSQYRGVTFYRRTGRWESHIWDCGKQVYLGGFDTAHAAARAYDRAAIKFRGIDADINFNTDDYGEDIKQTKNLTKEEFVYALRRHSSGFSRGSSRFQGSMFRKRGTRVEPMLGKMVSDNLDLSLGISQYAGVLIGNERMGVTGGHVNGGAKMDGRDAARVDGRQPPAVATAAQRCSNWGRQMSRSGKVSPALVFSAAAASSGFSSFAPVAPAPAIPFNQPAISSLRS